MDLERRINSVFGGIDGLSSRKRIRWRRAASKVLAAPDFHPEASLQLVLHSAWPDFPRERDIESVWSRLIIIPEDLATTSRPEDFQHSQQNLEEQWDEVLEECGLRPILEVARIRKLPAEGVADLALGYARTSDVKKAHERGSSMQRQRLALTELRGCICVCFAYNGNGEPSYLPMGHERRPASAKLLQLLEDNSSLCTAFNQIFVPRSPMTTVRYMCLEALHRMSRETKFGLEDIDQLSSLGVRILCGQDHVAYVGDSNAVEPSCKLTVTIMLGNATYVRSQITHNTSAGRTKAQRQAAASATIPYHGLLGARASAWHHPAFSLEFAHRAITLMEHHADDADAVTALLLDMSRWMAADGADPNMMRQVLGGNFQITRDHFLGRVCAKWHRWALAADILSLPDAQAAAAVNAAITDAAPVVMATFSHRTNRAAAAV